MFRKNLIITYKSIKNNTVLLPESYFRLIHTYENGCLSMIFGDNVHYMSWAPYGSNIPDTEIGISSIVAKAIGLEEGTSVKCTLIPDVVTLDSLNVTALTRKDWEMLEVSSYRIQSTLLDQTKVVTNSQHLIVWINRAMTITVKIDCLKPNTTHGRLANNTEIIVAPFKSPTQKIEKIKTVTTKEIINGIKPKHPIETQTNNATDKKLMNLEAKFHQFESLMVELKKHVTHKFQFRVISSKWVDSQVCDLYLTRHNLPELLDINQVFLLKTHEDRDYFVNIRILSDNECFPKNIYPTVEMNDILMKQLNIEQFDRIVLKTKETMLNSIDKIELSPNNVVNPKTMKDIEHNFKQFVLENTKLYPILINQNQIFKLKDNYMVTVKIYPETSKYCLIDSEILKECKISCVEKVQAVVDVLNNSKSESGCDRSKESYVALDKFENIINLCVKRLIINLCLDDTNYLRKVENTIIIGNQNCGKSTICKKILAKLSEKPFYCYSDVFYCARNKGRKPESIQRDLRQMLTKCIVHAPSILILDNLDILTQNAVEQNQDGDYYNRVSDVIQRLIHDYTNDNAISVIATVTNKTNLNKRIYTSRGRHLFQNILTIPNLEKADREKIISGLCEQSKSNKLNYNRFANLTEGYNVGDLVQFIERGVFYAYRNDANSAILTNDILNESLAVTNTYCLQGIENNNKITTEDEDTESDQIAGLETVVSVLEEVLLWPAKYPDIFQNAPIRNQAGVLLYGPPGTGKTYLVSKLAKLWNLRMICVKGPELLAKYIGQSEENVRNLFNKARRARPCVLFFDEFDSLAPKRGHDSTGVTDRVVNQLLTELDGVEELKGVIVIAATSRPELLDSALLRSGRLDRLVECPLPNKSSRLEIFKTLSKSLHLDEDVDFQYFSDNSDNFTGADIKSILTSANMIAVKECLARDSVNIPKQVFIKQEHLLKAFKNTRPSLPPDDIQKYNQMYARFTNKEKPSRDFVAKRATLA